MVTTEITLVLILNPIHSCDQGLTHRKIVTIALPVSKRISFCGLRDLVIVFISKFS